VIIPQIVTAMHKIYKLKAVHNSFQFFIYINNYMTFVSLTIHSVDL